MKNQIGEIISRYMKNRTGTFCLGWKDLQTGETVYEKPDTSVPTASVYKIFTLAELMRRVDCGESLLEDRYPLSEVNRSMGSGVLFCLHDGLQPSLYDYAVLMMIISDNTAADTLFHLCGRDNIKRNILDAYGLQHTQCDLSCREMITRYYGYELESGETSMHYFSRCGRSLNNTPYFTCRTQDNNVTTVKEVTDFLQAVYLGKVISAEASGRMLDIMKICQTNTRIPKFLPKTVSVAHKTGTMDRVANDVGIVYTEKGNYILSLFYNGNESSDEEYVRNSKGAESDSLLAEVSRDIYQAWMEC